MAVISTAVYIYAPFKLFKAGNQVQVRVEQDQK